MTDAEIRAALPDCNGRPERLPVHLYESLVEYAINHRPTGGFLRLCLERDLYAVCHADDDLSMAALQVLVRFIHNDLPSGCHGCRSAVSEWLKQPPRGRAM